MFKLTINEILSFENLKFFAQIILLLKLNIKNIKNDKTLKKKRLLDSNCYFINIFMKLPKPLINKCYMLNVNQFEFYVFFFIIYVMQTKTFYVT